MISGVWLHFPVTVSDDQLVQQLTNSVYVTSWTHLISARWQFKYWHFNEIEIRKMTCCWCGQRSVSWLLMLVNAPTHWYVTTTSRRSATVVSLFTAAVMATQTGSWRTLTVTWRASKYRRLQATMTTSRVMIVIRPFLKLVALHNGLVKHTRTLYLEEKKLIKSSLSSDNSNLKTRKYTVPIAYKFKTQFLANVNSSSCSLYVINVNK